MNADRKRDIDSSVDKHCSALSPHERDVLKSFLLENDSLMKDLAIL